MLCNFFQMRFCTFISFPFPLVSRMLVGKTTHPGEFAVPVKQLISHYVAICACCCISLYKIVGLLVLLFSGILSTWCSRTWEKVDPTAAAVDWRQRPGWQHSSWGIITVVIPNAFLIPVVFAVITFLTINSFDINASVIYCSTELPL